MLNLYRQASGGECPVVLDLNTPSCGGSRFGCWTCTVVKQDRSMEGFIESGEEWMRPLNDFRNWLKDIRENSSMRQALRRDKTKGPGPFTLDARKQILEKLLNTESQVGRQLISDEDIIYIQQQWDRDFNAPNAAFKIAALYKREIAEMVQKDIHKTFPDELLQDLVGEFQLQEELIEELLRLVNEKYSSLEVIGSKAALLNDVKQTIEKAIEQQDLATFSE